MISISERFGDHAWLYEKEIQICLQGLNAVVNGFMIIKPYMQKGNRLLIIIDYPNVVSWIAKVIQDRKVDVSGLAELLLRRRLVILHELSADCQVSILQVPTDQNLADWLTRFVSHWKKILW